MLTVFQPATRLMNRLKYPQKFLILRCFVFLPLILILQKDADGQDELLSEVRQLVKTLAPKIMVLRTGFSFALTR